MRNFKLTNYCHYNNYSFLKRNELAQELKLNQLFSSFLLN